MEFYQRGGTRECDFYQYSPLAVIYSFVHPLISVLLLYHLIYTITHHLYWNGNLSDMDAMENCVILGSFAA